MISRRYSFIFAAAILVSVMVVVNSSNVIRIDTDKDVFITDEKFLSASLLR